MLQSYLEVISPPALKGVNDILTGIHRWEAKVASLKNRWDEELKDDLKLAILTFCIFATRKKNTNTEAE